jgi:hypothetical protein
MSKDTGCRDKSRERSVAIEPYMQENFDYGVEMWISDPLFKPAPLLWNYRYIANQGNLEIRSRSRAECQREQNEYDSFAKHRRRINIPYELSLT